MTETLVSSLMAVLVDQEMLPYLLAAQSFLAWTVVIEAVVNHRDPDGGDEELTGEDLDQEVFRRLEILFRNMADAGLTIA